MTLVYTSTSGPSQVQVELSTSGPTRGATIRELDSDDIANSSTVAGGTLTDALDDLQAQITPSASTRLGFVPVGSPRIGTTFAGCVLQAQTTWSTPAQVPTGIQFIWDLWPGGSGGCGGKAGSTGSAASNTGSPASGGAHKRIVLSREDILSRLPFAIVAGVRGLGSVGATRTGDLGGGTTLPASGGTVGGVSSIGGTLARAFPGAPGFLDLLASPVNKTGNSGGGTMSAGAQATTTTAVPGGNPGAPASGATGEGGAGSPPFVAGAAGLTAEHGGASAGCAAGAGSTALQPGGTSLYGCSAAGWGGQWSTGAAAVKGGNGGGPNGGIGGAPAVGSGSGALVAGNGADGGDGDITHGGDAGGGGGGCRLFSTASPASARGGDGGNGGFPGGSGAGGGDASFGTFVGLITDIIRGGDGGDGHDGLVLCTIT